MRPTPACINQKPEMPDEHQLLQISIGTVKCMLLETYAEYQEAWNNGDRYKAERADGGIRKLHQLLEKHGL